MTISAKEVKALRDRTGAGMMDCKKALQETNGDMEAAIDFLRAKGAAKAAKRAEKAANEGTIGSYIHFGGKVGVIPKFPRIASGDHGASLHIQKDAVGADGEDTV